MTIHTFIFIHKYSFSKDFPSYCYFFQQKYHFPTQITILQHPLQKKNFVQLVRNYTIFQGCSYSYSEHFEVVKGYRTSLQMKLPFISTVLK